MKKLLFIFLILQGCYSTPSHTNSEDLGNNTKVIVIDSCEYIEYDAGIGDQRTYSLTHKGNCSNPIHKCNEN